MRERNFEHLECDGVTLRCVVEGEGPLVVLLHGFPQCWYLWRHQIDPLVAAGYRVAVPDQRGYGGSDAPAEITDYDIVHLTDDVVGIADALGADRFVVIGHDWGAPVAWHTALLHEDRVRAVAGLSVPYTRLEKAELLTRQEFWGDRFWYMAYFQTPGIAEAELEADLRRSLGLIYFNMSGHPERAAFDFNKPKNAGLLDGLVEAPEPLPWLGEEDLDYYVEQYRRSGFRGPLNWYRNLERNPKVTPELREKHIAQPAMFLAGSRDPVLSFPGDSVGVMAKWVDDMRIQEIIEGPGHWLQMEAPEPVTAKILAFLEETANIP